MFPRPPRISAVLLLVCSFAVPAAHGSTDYGVPRTISAGLGDPEIATDGQGTWVAVWTSSDPALGITLGTTSVAVTRSTDDGQTWSTPQLVRAEFETDEDYPNVDIATDGQGTWIVAHSGATITPESGHVEISSSTDNGATWGTPVTIASSATKWNSRARIQSDGASTWIVAWGSHDEGYGVAFQRSTDGGASWSPTAFLSGSNGGNPELATDSNGTWGVVFTDSTDYSVQAVRSTDNGASWSAPTLLGNGTRPILATDGQGRWLAVWDTLDTLQTALSTDDGVMWQPHVQVPESDRIFLHSAAVVSRGEGEWQLMWQQVDFHLGPSLLGIDGDIMTMYSRDGGSTWSTPTALVAEARGDDGLSDGGVAAAVGASRKTIAIWAFGDQNQTGMKVAIAEQACPQVPREDCFHSSSAGSGSLSISDALTGKDRLVWKWSEGTGTTDADLGNPVVSGDYAVCLYEKSGSAVGLIGEWDARAATTCGTDPCWRKSTNKLVYRDQKLTQGSIAKMYVRTGTPGSDQVRVSMGAPALAPPALPLDTTAPVRMQLLSVGTDKCWESIHTQAGTNEPTRFRSLAD